MGKDGVQDNTSPPGTCIPRASVPGGYTTPSYLRIEQPHCFLSSVPAGSSVGVHAGLRVSVRGVRGCAWWVYGGEEKDTWFQEWMKRGGDGAHSWTLLRWANVRSNRL